MNWWGQLTGAAGALYACIVHEQTVRHRFFASALSPPAVVLGEAEAHHALHVLRLRAGEPIELFDGQGRWAIGRIAAGGRREVNVQVESVHGPVLRPRPRIHLAFALPKGKRLDWLLEKAAELGAASLHMLICSRSVVTPAGGPAALARYQAICVSAIRQSRQLYLPQIDPPAELVKFLAAPHAGVRILADCGPQTPPLRLMAGPPAAEDVTVLIGPEGGWSPEEIAQARQREFQPARLGSSTLRVETAAIAITAAIGALYDVFQSAPPCAATDHHPSEGG